MTATVTSSVLQGQTGKMNLPKALPTKETCSKASAARTKHPENTCMTATAT